MYYARTTAIILCRSGSSARSRIWWPEIRSSRETSVGHRQPCVVWAHSELCRSFSRRCGVWQGAPRRSLSWCQTWGHWGSELIASPSRGSPTCQRGVQSERYVHTPRRRWRSTSISPAAAATQAEDSWQLTISMYCEIFSLCIAPLSSNWQHLSYDVCLEVRREIIRTVLCCSLLCRLKLYEYQHWKSAFIISCPLLNSCKSVPCQWVSMDKQNYM